jgi:hypothetical protein
VLKGLIIVLAGLFGLGSVLVGVICAVAAIREQPLIQEEENRLIYRS